jgi:ABC-type transport system substrate-binding protein
MRRALLSVLLLGILAVTIVPTYGWVIPPNPAGEDYKYELYGPHVKGIVIKIYATATAEWNAMDAGQLDLEDWALDAAHATAWSTANGPITEANYGGEDGYYLLDINNNATFTPADNVTGTYNPTSSLALRQAIAACCNRSDVVSFTGGFALPMYTMVPPYMGGYINTGIAPGQAYDALTYGGYNGNLTLANAILDAGGFPWNPAHTVRLDSHNGNATLNLIFYSRGGDRGIFGNHLNVALNAAGIGTTYHSNVPRSEVTGPVFAQEYFNLYTGGWTGIGPDPDYLDDLYTGKNYYHPGSPPNYCNVNFPETNANGSTIKLASSLAVGLAATLDFQYWFAFHCASVPLWCYTGFKAYKNVPVEAGATGNWTHLVNQLGVGVNSWWSTLNMYENGNLYPPNFTYYGFSSTITSLNMIYAQWYWDFEVLGRIYDCGARRDPMTVASWVPQLYKSWTIGTWNDPSAGGATKTAVTITLRPDVYWSDGQPFTVADVYYTLVEISKDLLAKGFPPPSWWPIVQYIRSVEIIDDYNIQILLDVNSLWAAGWVIGSVIVPKHIWKPIVDASISPTNNPVVQGTTPDPNIIGSGPFRWESGTGETVGDTIVMVANTPGSIVNGITSPGYYFYNPVYVDINPDNGYSKINLAPADASVVANITISARNLYQGGTLDGDKYVYVNGVLQAGYPHLGVTLPPVQPWNTSNPYPADPAGAAHVETLHLNFSQASLNFVKAAFKVTGPSTLPDGEANPWLGTWVNVTLPIWATQKMDIAGTTLYDVLGYSAYPSWLKNDAPAPDLKVDGKDISKPAHAFGTVPGDSRWNTVADVSKDFKVDGKDIALVALQFGW